MTLRARIARVVRGSLWVVVAALAVATAVELFLQARSRRIEAGRTLTAAQQLDRAYNPFSIQHLHPQYFFFFPSDPAARLAMNNAVVSIDADGFREPGLSSAGARPLAVLLGGSTAFGHYASSNATTITSQLNALQRELFFLNAGAPSWTSGQELIRMVVQIADLRPVVVIALDGVNDAAVSGQRSARTGQPYPPGTPESFDDLERHVEDIRAGQVATWPLLFPELSLRVRRLLGQSGAASSARSPQPFPTPEQLTASARAYVSNHVKMSAVARSSGARFVSVFQPFGDDDPDDPLEAALAGFRDAVIGHVPPTLEFHDLFNALDEPSGGPVPPFVDAVHLSDDGNKRIAQLLWAIVRDGRAGKW